MLARICKPSSGPAPASRRRTGACLPAPDRRKRAVGGASAKLVVGPHSAAAAVALPAAECGTETVR